MTTSSEPKDTILPDSGVRIDEQERANALLDSVPVVEGVKLRRKQLPADDIEEPAAAFPVGRPTGGVHSASAQAPSAPPVLVRQRPHVPCSFIFLRATPDDDIFDGCLPRSEDEG